MDTAHDRAGDGLVWTIDMLGRNLSAALAENERLSKENEALRGALNPQPPNS